MTDTANRRDRKVGRVIRNSFSSYSALFSATFDSETVEADVVKCQGADPIFISECFLTPIVKGSLNVKIGHLDANKIYHAISGEARLERSKKPR